MYQNLCTTKFRWMVLIEINHHKTTEVKLNEEMMLAIMHAIGFADDQSITWYKLCLVPRRLSRCARKGRREGVPFPWSLAVYHQSLVSRSPLPCEKRSAWGGGWYKLASEINPETHLQWKHVKHSCRWWTNKFMNGKMIRLVNSIILS